MSLRLPFSFFSCFGSGSIAGQALRSNSSIAASISLRKSLIRFGKCRHGSQELLSNPCLDCAVDLMRISRITQERVPSASRFCSALADAVGPEFAQDVRLLALASSEILRRAIEVRGEYFGTLQSRQCQESEFYNRVHCTGDSLLGDSNENWLSEAQRTGEFFPGRPLVRPGL